MKAIVIKIVSILFFMLYAEMVMAKPSVISSSFHSPTGIAFNSFGDMFVTNWSNNSIAKVTQDGKYETFFTGIDSPAGIVIDSDNNIYVASYGGDYILKVDTNGLSKKISEGFNTPTGITFSHSGKLLITNRSSGEIVALNLSTGEKEIIVNDLITPVGVTELQDGSLAISQYSGRLTHISPNGQRKELGADFERPGVGIIADSKDTVVVIDNGAGAIRRVNVLTGQIETVADGLSGAVALSSYNDSYYVGTWTDGSVRVLSKN